MRPEIDREAGFVRFGGKGYALRQINSIEVREHELRAKGGGTGWFVLAAIGLIVALLNPSGGRLVFGLLAAALFGLLAWRASKRPRLVEYRLFLTTSSSEAQAWSTQDRAEIEQLRRSLEIAIADRP